MYENYIIFASALSYLVDKLSLFCLLNILINLLGFIYVQLNDNGSIELFMKHNVIYASNRYIKNKECHKTGYFISSSGIGHITRNNNNSPIITLITTKKILNNIIGYIECKLPDNIDKNNIVNTKIRRYNGASSFIYQDRNLESKLVPWKEQSVIIDDIITYYNKHNKCVAFISGNPGSGKTVIGMFLAMKINAYFVKTFRPTDQGDHIELIYDSMTHHNKYKSKKLVILLDEIDCILSNLANITKTNKQYRDFMVKDKTTWNRFLDDIGSLYPDVILLLISNKSREDINNIDPSYIRPGRVDRYFELQHHQKVN